MAKNRLNSNGHTKKSHTVMSAMEMNACQDAPKTLELTAEQANEIRKCETDITQHKSRMADLYLASQNIQKRLHEATQELAGLEEAMLKKAKEIARASGLNLETEENGRWNLDTSTMVFSRVS